MAYFVVSVSQLIQFVWRRKRKSQWRHCCDHLVGHVGHIVCAIRMSLYTVCCVYSVLCVCTACCVYSVLCIQCAVCTVCTVCCVYSVLCVRCAVCTLCCVYTVLCVAQSRHLVLVLVVMRSPS